MIERTRANAEHSGNGGERRPSFLVGEVSSLAFPDGSFDVVVSTPSQAAGLGSLRLPGEDFIRRTSRRTSRTIAHLRRSALEDHL